MFSRVLQGLSRSRSFLCSSPTRARTRNGRSRSFCFVRKSITFPAQKNPPSTFVSFVALPFPKLVAFIQFLFVHSQQAWQTTQPHRNKATVSPVLPTPSSTTSTGNHPRLAHLLGARLTDSAATTTMESTRRCSRTTCALAATATPFTRTVTCSRTRLSSMSAAEPAFCPCAHSLLPHFHTRQHAETQSTGSPQRLAPSTSSVLTCRPSSTRPRKSSRSTV